MLAFPAIYGDDSVVRLARSDTLVLASQLPLAQLVVFVARALHPDPLWVRLAFAAIGSAVPLALARGVTLLGGATAGRVAGILSALHPLLVYYSLVPYQDGMMLLLVLVGATALARRRDRAASLWLGLACLTRYEAWFAAALAILSRRRRPLRALVLFGWVPCLWVLAWGGLSPAGTLVLDLDPEAARLSRLGFLLGKLHEYSGTLPLALAAAGAVVVAYRRDRRWVWPAAFVALALLAVVIAGHELQQGTGRVSERMAHIPAVALCALAGVAVGTLATAPGRGRLARGLAAAAVVAALGVSWTRQVHALVAEANRDPSLRLAMELAHFAAVHLGPGERLAVASPGVLAEVLDEYARKVERMGGDPARARAVAAEWASYSRDLNRVAAHLARPPGMVVPAGSGSAALVAVYDDAPNAERWRAGPAVWRATSGSRGVTVYSPPH